MQAPEAFQKDDVRYCRMCGKEIPINPGRGRYAYCPPPALCAFEGRREQVREAVKRFNDGVPADVKNASRNAYRFIRRQGLDRREFLTGSAALFLGVQLETWPVTRTAQYEKAAKTLDKLRQALLAGDRDVVTHGVLTLQGLLGGDNSRFAFRVQTHCEELLRDAGEVGDWSTGGPDSEKVFKIVENRAMVIEDRWAREGNWLNLVWALLTRASLYRQRKRERVAMDLLKGAEYILKGLSSNMNHEIVNLLLHQTLSWRLRLGAFYLQEIDPDEAKQDFARLYELADASGSPITRIVTARDEGAFWAPLYEVAQSKSILEEARSRFRSLPVDSAIADLSLRRSEIELLLNLKQGEAINQVREYERTWHKNPTATQLGALRTLVAKCHLSPIGTADRPRIYSTPILAEIWMDGRLTTL